MKSSKLKFKIIFIAIIFCGVFGLAKSSWAATYWVSSTGSAANLAACSGATPLSGASACSYDEANGSGVVAGDTVYYRAGSYTGITTSAINPYNTGTAGNVITFSAYNNEDVEFTGSGLSSVAVNLDSEYGTVRSYIKVSGMTFNNFNKHLWIRKGGHNEVSYCTFLGYPTTAASSGDLAWSASYVYRQAQYNWIHHNTFGNYGWCNPYGTDYGVVFQMGLESDITDQTKYNLVEYNTMYHGGHHVISLNGTNNVYRNNYLRNDPWCGSSSTYATRTVFQTGVDGDGKYNLSESNRIGYGGPKNKSEIGGAGGTISSAYNIWRYNTYAQIYTVGMWVTKYSGQSDVKYNKVYNNTFWHGGYGTYQKSPGGTVPSGSWDDSLTHGIDITEDDGSTIHDNVFKNNLFYQNNDLRGTAYSIINHNTHVVPTYQSISNNWLDNAGDPKFISTSGTPDPTNGSQWDFNLQSGSGAINIGTYLTTVSSVTDSNTFVVPSMDAGYFFDGWGIPAGIAGATIGADYICLTPGVTVNYDHCVQISSIDYANDIINTVTAHGASTGWYVWLYKKSDGTRVLYGTASDIGAYEYVSGGDTTPPAAPSRLSVQ